MRALDYALAEQGVKEVAGARHNPTVVNYFHEAGFSNINDDETAWCAAFANAMEIRAGNKGTGSLAARSFLNYGEKVDPSDVQEGDIAIFPRGKAWQGHVGYVVKRKGAFVDIISGNSNNEVNIKSYAVKQALGFRRMKAKEKESFWSKVASWFGM